jgi:hypothetical protein
MKGRYTSVGELPAQFEGSARALDVHCMLVEREITEGLSGRGGSACTEAVILPFLVSAAFSLAALKVAAAAKAKAKTSEYDQCFHLSLV